MFPTERPRRACRLPGIWSWVLCAVATWLAFAPGLALAAEAEPGAPPVTVRAAVDDGAMVSQWHVFDPGFVLDHLPFKMTVGQTISYNDNVQNTSLNFPLLVNNNAVLRLPSRGDFYSDTTISAASRFPMGADTFFFNGTYAPRRYFRDTQLNADNYSINGGVDFNLADRCSGRLIAGTSSYQAPQLETAGFGINTITSDSFNETARCTITGHVFGLLNTGVSRQENTGSSIVVGNTILPFGLNNYDQQYVGIGLEYDLSGLDTLRGMATFTNRDFLNRPAGLGLSPRTQQNDFFFTYTRVLSAKLDFSASGGASVFSGVTGGGETTEPVYAFTANYRPTPKFTASFTESRSSGAPQSVIADVQTTDAQTLSLNYRYSPKLTVSGVLSHSETENPLLGRTNLANNTLPIAFADSNYDNASVILTYTASPMVTATAAYTYSERTDAVRNLNAVSNIFRVGLFYTR